MKSWKSVVAIFKKEFRAHLNSPASYIVVVAFLLLWEFFFFKNVFIIGEASLGSLFGLLPWFFLILVPAITMGSIAQEKSEETFEFLLTHPLRDSDMLFGKFLGALAFIGSILFFVIPVALSLSAFGDIDWGIVWAQYLAAILFASVFTAMGIFVSSLLKSQIASLMVTVVAGFFLIISATGVVTSGIPHWIASIFEQYSALTHFNSMARGVIDLRDVWYFISFTVMFLALAQSRLILRRYGKKNQEYLDFRIVTVAVLSVAIITNAFNSAIPGRIDMTEGDIFTLTNATTELLSNLATDVDITLYASKDMVPQLSPVMREVEAMLADYQTYGDGHVTLTAKDPQSNTEIAQEAHMLGVQPIRANIIEDNAQQVRQIYFGLVVSTDEGSEAIPFVGGTADLEYQLTSFITTLTNTDKKVVAFLGGHGELGMLDGFSAFTSEIERQFELTDFILDDDNVSIPETIDTLIVASPTEEYSYEVLSALEIYIENGGSVLFLIDTMDIEMESLTVTPRTTNIGTLLEKYGITVNQDIIYDLRSNKTIQFGGGIINYLLPYPFFPQVVASKETTLTSRLRNMVMPWPSSIDVNKAVYSVRGLEIDTLFTTTQYAGVQTENFTLQPQAKLRNTGLGVKRTAVRIQSTAGAGLDNGLRLVVVGDSDILKDEYAGASTENIAFGMEAISWLSQEQSLAGIQVKQQVARPLVFENPTQMSVVKYANLSIVFLFPTAIALLRFAHRRSLRKRQYTTQ